MGFEPDQSAMAGSNFFFSNGVDFGGSINFDEKIYLFLISKSMKKFEGGNFDADGNFQGEWDEESAAEREKRRERYNTIFFIIIGHVLDRFWAILKCFFIILSLN